MSGHKTGSVYKGYAIEYRRRRRVTLDISETYRAKKVGAN
jgi:hypothetical protein